MLAPQLVDGLLPGANGGLVVNPTACEFLHDGSPGLLPACYLF
jgi:hypothetical protein